jgi:hypothetical protein
MAQPRSSIYYRSRHLIGWAYLELLPSPDDLPRIRRQIQGSKKIPTHAMFMKNLKTLFFSLIAGSGMRQF